jgi:glycosyltransferase involved in cell wall biosynthesis
MNKVDVIIRTLNSDAKFEECLTAIEKYVPYNKIIVVDGGSTDRTISIAMSHPSVELHIKEGLSLLEAFLYGASKATTNVIASIDSDVVIHDGWFERLYEHFTYNIGAVEGRDTCNYKLSSSGEKNRGYLINALLSRESILKIKPCVMKVREDAYLFYEMKKHTHHSQDPEHPLSCVERPVHHQQEQ